jgi:hypothetical protein
MSDLFANDAGSPVKFVTVHTIKIKDGDREFHIAGHRTCEFEDGSIVDYPIFYEDLMSGLGKQRHA